MTAKRCAVVAVGLLIFTLLLPSSSTAQATPKQVKIEQILKLTRADTSVEQMMSQFKTMMSSQFPQIPADEAAKMQETQGKLLELINSRFSLTKMLPEYTRIYDETFSDEEIDGIYAFFTSPAGFAMINKAPLVFPKM